MTTLIKIAWRNIWRNKLRSIIVMTSIVLGIWSGLFIMGLTLGLNDQRMEGAVNSYLSHVQVHHPKFQEDYNIKYTLEDPAMLIERIGNNDKIKAYAERTIVPGMASTSSGSSAVQMLGIDPVQESRVTSVSENLVDGTYFTRFKRNPAVVGQKLAEKLGLEVKDKLVVSFQDINNNIVSSSLRIEGIYKTQNSMFDELSLFVRMEDLQDMAGLEGEIHEMAILGYNIDDVESISASLKSEDSNQLVQSWKEIAPELGYAEEMMGSMIYIFMGIILLALAFGIINTMLMAVLERKRELGMLMSVGMNKMRIFLMIILETIFLAAVATPIGMGLSAWSIGYFGTKGIDLSMVAKGLESLGVGSKVYTSLPIEYYGTITIMTLMVTLVAAIFPARRALKLNPAEAVRSL